jgi:hypothetical protein
LLCLLLKNNIGLPWKKLFARDDFAGGFALGRFNPDKSQSIFQKVFGIYICIFQKGSMFISSVITAPCNRLMEGISQAWKNMVNYKNRNLIVAPASQPASYFCKPSAAGENNAGFRSSVRSVANGGASTGDSTTAIRMVLAPDKTMVPDDMFRPVYVRPIKVYGSIGNDNPRFPRTNIPMPSPGSKSESAPDSDFGYESVPEIAGKAASPVTADHPVTVNGSSGDLQNKAASDLNAAGVAKIPQTKEQSLERIKFLIAIEDRRAKFLNSNEDALGRLMNKSGIALFGIKNSCEETYKDVYSKHFDIAYAQEMSGHKPHAEILRSAHIHADQTAQAYLSGRDDDVDAKNYGNFLLAQSFQTEVSRCRTYCRAVNSHFFAKTLYASGYALSKKMDAMEAVYLKSYNDVFQFSCEKKSEKAFSAEILRDAHNLANDAALGDVKALESEDGNRYADAWAHFTMNFCANGLPANYSLRSNKFAARVLQPVPASVDEETRL